MTAVPMDKPTLLAEVKKRKLKDVMAVLREMALRTTRRAASAWPPC